MRKRIDTTPMQIQKLVYLCHGWILGGTGQPLILDKIEAWDYGPVIPVLYHRFKEYRGDPITESGEDFSEYFGDDFNKSLIEDVLKRYRDLNGIKLSSITHESDSPWDRTIKKHGRGATIENDLIEQYYTRVLYDLYAKANNDE